MKLLLFSCLIVAAAAAPQFVSEFTQPQDRPLAIVKDERQNTGDGNFNYDFETENGIVVNVVGNLGPQGQNMQGGFRFPLPDGTLAEVRYVANENGFQPESSLLPTPHPLPAHAVEQIRVAEEQRRLGITFP
ncbi:hypothetical protein Pcinc_035455 [Petrolisthes cinctipes]|uniref:Uncharacterized protein n=1 Tax=Petrolisthes cinctipes TaxID=88211 RepID=A0AAE1BWJ3_PETCI|nr:hypothetical protein Pcinc_035455 [Petrolisthes cinctipes]